MSLRPDDRSSRKRDKSGTRDRSRSRSNVRAPEAPKAPSPPAAPGYGQAPSSNMPGSFADDEPVYEMRSPTSAGAERSEYARPKPGRTSTYPAPSSVPYPMDDHFDDRYKSPRDRPDHDVPRFPEMPPMPDDDLIYGDLASPNGSRQNSYSSAYPGQRPTDPYAPQAPGRPEMPTWPRAPEPPSGNSRSSSYAHDHDQPPREEYRSSKSRAETWGPSYDADSRADARGAPYNDQPRDQRREDPKRTHSYDQYNRDANIVDITPGRDKLDTKSSSSKTARLSVDTRSGGLDAPRSPGLSARTDRLSVSGNRPVLSGSVDLPPPSPLLEAYHGTYQSISPMPMAMRLDDDDDLDALEPLSPQTTRGGNDKLAQDVKKKKKSVKVDDYEADAQRIHTALSKSRIDAETLCEILPGLTQDQVVYVRKEYKKLVKVQGKGVNLAKHLKTKLPGNFGKAAYVTTLGRWESEGYWANFWYQSHTSRRELLIESLMGRTNREIHEIKDEFRDKRYADDLVKCMEKELKMDKFRVAVLMALEGRRQEEQDVYPMEYRNRDVDTLHNALTANKGGESAMLEIIVRRSDAHLREVMKTYDRMHQTNFPRAALQKSSNLVGEVIAHILNGVINKPVRDAALLKHAIKDIAAKNRDDELRYELLISRLVRLHWDKPHLSKVKREYFTKYNKHLETDIEDSTSGDFTDFMWELCKTEKKA